MGNGEGKGRKNAFSSIISNGRGRAAARPAARQDLVGRRLDGDVVLDLEGQGIHGRVQAELALGRGAVMENGMDGEGQWLDGERELRAHALNFSLFLLTGPAQQPR